MDGLNTGVFQGNSGPLADVSLEIGGRPWKIVAASSPDALLADVQTDADLADFPYGLLLWPSSVALAEWIANIPDSIQGRRVLELGCGPGLPGLVAQWRGGEVTQTDYQDAPLVLARHNAILNGITGISCLTGDWRDFPPVVPFDLVIGSDILYERALHPVLSSLLPRVLAPGGSLLLGDPLRPAAAAFVDKLEQAGWQVTMDVNTIAWQGERMEIALFTARREKL